MFHVKQITSSRLLILFTVLFTFFLHGCATMPYPICYFNESPSEEKAQYDRTKLEKVLRLYASEHGNIAFTSDGRWVAVRTTLNNHHEIKKIWPRFGCIGRHRAESEEKYYRRCIGYIRKLLTTKKYDITPFPPSGGARSGYLYCDGKP